MFNWPRAAVILAVSSLLSQILGLFRDRLLAGSFGAGTELDIYYAAFRLPDLLYVSLGSLVSVTILVPIIIERRQTGVEATERLIGSLFTVFSLFMLVGLTVIFFLVPLLAPVLAPGFTPVAHSQFILLTRILLLSPFLLGLSNLVGSVGHAAQRFTLYALSPLVYNLGIIAGIIFLVPRWGLAGLALGVALGALLHLVVQWPNLHHHGLRPRWVWPIAWREALEVARLSLPRTLGLAAHQLAFLVLTALASRLAVGSIAIFSLAYNLQSVPLGLVAMSYAVAAFPSLTAARVKQDWDAFRREVINAARQIILWSAPLLVLTIILSERLVRLLFGVGRFSDVDVKLTATVLSVFIVSLLAQGLISLLIRAYYAAGYTRRPLIVNLFGAALMIVVAAGFIYFFPAADWSLFILPGAFSLAMIINLIWLWRDFHHDLGGGGLNPIYFGKIILAAVLAALTSALVVYFWPVTIASTYVNLLVSTAAAGLAGLSAYLLVIYLSSQSVLKLTHHDQPGNTKF
ncbi:MAG: murein biosynthesis integral membrane protein MurJ [Patescibacteria group bacterium]